MSGWVAARELQGHTCRFKQNGQPLLEATRCCTLACHSWGCWQFDLGQCHQTRFVLPQVTPWVVRLPFLVECHSSARSGRCCIRLPCLHLLRLDTLAHSGQPAGWSGSALLFTTAFHGGCEELLLHIHQALKVLLGSTTSGLTGLFLLGCHSSARSGCTACRLVHRHGRWLAQKGHPVPFLARLLIDADHS